MNILRILAQTALASLFAACNEAPQAPVPPALPLTNTTWFLRSLHSGKSLLIVPGANYSLRFSDTGLVRAQLGCNQLSSAYLATATTVKLTGEGVMTDVQCGPDSLSAEMRAVLNNETAGYSIEDSTLCLTHDTRKACFRPQ